jgi:signal transduction histidine kinase
MEEKSNSTELLLATHYQLIDAIMCRCTEPESVLRKIMAQNIQGYGTGKHEIFNNCDEYIEIIFKVFVNQLPQGAQIHFLNLQTSIIDNVGIVHGPYEISYETEGEMQRFYMRRTVVYKWTEDFWQAVHLHASSPATDLAEGESWPVKALKAQNEELIKQVAVRTAELSRQKEELQRTLTHLKATQAQLIQSEKMASLGELTAGIAHEIQNPLNFVNNFSETNNELVQEAKNELQSSHILEGLSILDDIQENSQKIALHGKRAEGIVKSMLEHSRISKGEKQETDINALADEYLRLAYHGFRSKDKTFNAAIQTQYDDGIDKISIVPQDIGRVLLNLFNNSFYAVSERQKQLVNYYKPTVTVSSKKVSDRIEIRVKDNGTDIPQAVVDKIFQPFFTTKPTGQGTGLGLSLSYDIIKAHGGELKVESAEGEGSVFTIILPM